MAVLRRPALRRPAPARPAAYDPQRLAGYTVASFGPGGELLERRTVSFDAKAQQAAWDAEAAGIQNPAEDLSIPAGAALLTGLFIIVTLLIVAFSGPAA